MFFVFRYGKLAYLWVAGIGLALALVWAGGGGHGWVWFLYKKMQGWASRVEMDGGMYRSISDILPTTENRSSIRFRSMLLSGVVFAPM